MSRKEATSNIPGGQESLYLRASLRQRLWAHCEAKGVSRGSVISAAVERYIDEMDNETEV